MRRLALLFALLCLPLTLACACVAFNAVNPMQRAFIDPLTIHNKSARHLRVTPIGEAGGVPWVLSQFTSRSFGWPAPRSSHHDLAPGGELTILYDADDICATGVIVDDGASRPRFAMGSAGPRACYHERVTIGPLAILPDATERQIAAVGEAGTLWGYVLAHVICAFGPISLVLLALAWRQRPDENDD